MLGCHYITLDVKFANRDVRLFVCKRCTWVKWNGLITTNSMLNFLEAYKILLLSAKTFLIVQN